MDFVQGIETGKYVVVQTSQELSLHFVVPRLVPRAMYPASSPWVIVCALSLSGPVRHFMLARGQLKYAWVVYVLQYIPVLPRLPLFRLPCIFR